MPESGVTDNHATDQRPSNDQYSLPADVQSDGTIGGEMEALAAVMKRLRAEDGCPWDRAQTHESLRTYLLEETYEVISAIDAGDMDVKVMQSFLP